MVHQLRKPTHLNRLHGSPLLVDKTKFGIVHCNQTNFYRFEESSSYRSVKRISVFLFFSLVNQWHTSGIAVYNRTVTNIGNTVRAVHSCFSEATEPIKITFWVTRIVGLCTKSRLFESHHWQQMKKALYRLSTNCESDDIQNNKTCQGQ